MSKLKFIVFSFTLLLLKVNARYILVTDHVYFDIEIDDKPVGRMVFGLFGNIVPKTVENFKILASQGINGMKYAGTPFHRVIRRFMIQGGDIINYDGSGSISIYGSTFDDENFEINHTASGFLSMSNSGPNTNGCQFFITTRPTPWLDGKHTVFGKIVDGQSLLHKIEYIETDGKDRPLKPVVITQAGIDNLTDTYEISDEDYGLWQWIRASFVPLSWSFTILGFFHWVMKKLDTQL